jgi:predicted nucleic acid-binding protein
MRHIFVETNWVVDYAAPAHHQKPAARSLLDRAHAGELRLYLPATCLSEARRTIQKFKPRHEADAIRSFIRWERMASGKISDADDAVVRRVLDMFETKVHGDLKRLDVTLSSLRGHDGIEVFALDEAMLDRSIDLSGGDLDLLKPFDQTILAAVLVRAERLRVTGEVDISFCELDADLQPWDRRGNPKAPLKQMYDAAGIWVYGDFDLNEPARPADWVVLPRA